jgi:predicted PurR-regulated permease PerM
MLINNKPLIFRIFLLILIAAIAIACYFVFRPFLVEILIAAVLVTIFYKPYEWLTKKLWNKRALAALVMCLAVVLVIIIPLTNLIIYCAQKSVTAYHDVVEFLDESGISSANNKNIILDKASDVGISGEKVQEMIADLAQKSSNWLVGGATSLVKGTTSFLISLFLVIFTMFFFFLDGAKMLKRMMYLTPLPNKYDREIFKKFKDVSYSTFVSTFVVAVAQGLLGAIGFMIVGLPAFFPGIIIAFTSIMPYVGSVTITLPAAIYLLVTGKIWQGIFMLVWGLVVVANVDNLLRAYIVQAKSEVHPIFLIFSILGGIALFGFWGVLIGPLVIALAITIFHIYELEYKGCLEK